MITLSRSLDVFRRHSSLRVVETNNRADAKECKKLLSQNNLGNYFDDPIHLLEASGALAATLQQGGCITVHKRRFFLKEQQGVGLHNFVKLSLHSLELNFSVFCHIVGEWT